MIVANSGRPRIAIAHQTVMLGDAIGNDMGGAYRLLGGLGFDVSIACEFLYNSKAEGYRVVKGLAASEMARRFDLLLYHHSVEWPLGEAWVAGFAGPVIVKYHNITPSTFFEPYSVRYTEACARGRLETARLAAFANVVRWQADSAFNAEEIRGLGVGDDRISVVPPFMRCDEIFKSALRAEHDASGPIELLFVGRRVPNKGHRHLLRTLSAFRDLFPLEPIRLTMVGAVDEQMSDYYRELEELERTLGVTDQVRWLQHLSDEDVRELFETSHVYLNLSEHEGFCVPAVEAQAVGLPLVSSGSGAIPETIGEGQVVVAEPRCAADYDVIAGIVRSVARDPGLRSRLQEAGYRNVYRRFTSEVLENRFLEAVSPWLRSSLQ
jgi:glycosyltransferase involved in cell wall biosynthesis